MSLGAEARIEMEINQHLKEMKMMEFDNTNRGQIWKNTRKEKDTHPDYTGTINVEGVEYWVSAWKRKEGASDKAPLLSFSIKRKDSKDDFKAAVKQQGMDKSKPSDDFSDDVPW